MAEEMARMKTESFINKTLYLDKQNELDNLNYEINTIKMLTMNKVSLLNNNLNNNDDEFKRDTNSNTLNLLANQSKKEIENKHKIFENSNDMLSEYEH